MQLNPSIFYFYLFHNGDDQLLSFIGSLTISSSLCFHHHLGLHNYYLTVLSCCIILPRFGWFQSVARASSAQDMAKGKPMALLLMICFLFLFLFPLASAAEVCTWLGWLDDQILWWRILFFILSSFHALASRLVHNNLHLHTPLLSIDLKIIDYNGVVSEDLNNGDDIDNHHKVTPTLALPSQQRNKHIYET